jgi:hypothetical protein
VAKLRLEDVEISEFWNEDEDHFSNDQYNTLLMEQYKLYVEMADRASFRRTLINLFFLIVNILIISLVALGLSRTTSELSMVLMLMPFLGLIAICYCWWRLVRYFRHMVTIKDKVIGELEKRLPSSPIWKAEQDAIQRKGAQNPLKRMEVYMPYTFAILYIAIYIYLLVSPPWH